MSVVEFPEIAGAPFAGEPSPAAAGDAEPGATTPVVDVAAIAAAEDLIEWTPDRAAAVVRGFGLVLHTLDPATGLDGGNDLWRATSQEAGEIGAPLSRILARYAPARRLAGVVDEAELGAAFVSYAKRNLRTRGSVVLAAKEETREAFGGTAD